MSTTRRDFVIGTGATMAATGLPSAAVPNNPAAAGELLAAFTEELLADYPVAALNWHVGETPPTIADYRARGGRKPVVGGLRRMPITAGDRAAVRADLAAVLAADSGRGVILSPGCVIRHPVDRALLAQVAADIAKGTA